LVRAVTQPHPPGQPAHPPPYNPYPPQPYGGWPYQPYPPPAANPGVNGFAVASLVLGITGGVPLSVIFGIVALVQMRTRAYRGKGMAIAGLVLSGVWVVGFATLIVVLIASAADRDSSGQLTEGGSVSAYQLRPGDCVNDLEERNNILSVRGVPCAQPHEGEVFASFAVSGSTWPGEASISQQAEDGCQDRFQAYAPNADAESLDLFSLQPTRQTWARGDREVICIAIDPAGKRTGSLRN
jgi:hypothetical protein